MKPSFRSAPCVDKTCSIQGLKQHTLATRFRVNTLERCGIASHGDGKSKNAQSALIVLVPSLTSLLNPSAQTSRCWATTTWSKPWDVNSAVFNSCRLAWNSKVYTFPPGETCLAIAWVILPLPVPASRHTVPGRTWSFDKMNEVSGVYTICVRWGRARVHNSGDGRSK